MIKKIFILGSLILGYQYLFAFNQGNGTNDNSIAIILILIVAILALILAVINFFRISTYKRIAEVDMVNQKDDLNVTMENVKVDLARDLRNLRREVSKLARPQNQKDNKNQAQGAAGAEKKATLTETDTKTEKPAAEKKPFRYNSNKKRRKPYKKPEHKNTGSAPE